MNWNMAIPLLALGCALSRLRLRGGDARRGITPHSTHSDSFIPSEVRGDEFGEAHELAHAFHHSIHGLQPISLCLCVFVVNSTCFGRCSLYSRAHGFQTDPLLIFVKE